MKSFDIIICGIGPAGAAAALALSHSGLSVLMIDRHEFPRNKICGDALSPDVVNQLHKLPLDTGPLFEQMEQKIWCKAVRFFGPNYTAADLRLSENGPTGFVSERLHFDQFMFEQVQKAPNASIITGHKLNRIEVTPSYVEVTLDNGDLYRSAIVLGADGAQSVVARQLANQSVDKNHHCAGLRQYYENVEGFSADHAVELHFYKEFLPGYFWIFPLPNNRANVGVGMLSRFVADKNINLKERLQDIIANHPNVRDRFKNARAVESIKGFSLPLGSKKRSISGNRYLLLGDAASLINPLSGEGIGNAIRSGRIAAEHLIKIFPAQQFDAEVNKAYDREVYRLMWGELRANYYIQRIMRNEWLCNAVIKHAIGNPFVQKQLLSGFSI